MAGADFQYNPVYPVVRWKYNNKDKFLFMLDANNKHVVQFHSYMDHYNTACLDALNILLSALILFIIGRCIIKQDAILLYVIIDALLIGILYKSVLYAKRISKVVRITINGQYAIYRGIDQMMHSIDQIYEYRRKQATPRNVPRLPPIEEQDGWRSHAWQS
jgi:hypothetical protein